MRTILFLAFIAFATVVLGCTAPQAGQRLRLKSDSTAPITNLRVLFPNKEISFGNIAPQATTEYKNSTKGVYRYSAFKYDVNGQTITQPVIDWVGEEPMEGSAFTYTIQFDPSNPQIQAIQLTNVTRDQ